MNENIITFVASSSATAQAQIPAQLGQTLKTQVSIPAGKRGYISRFFFNVGKGDDARCIILARDFGKAWRVRRDLQNFQSHIAVQLDDYIDIGPRGDIKMQAAASTGTITVAAGYDYYLVRT